MDKFLKKNRIRPTNIRRAIAALLFDGVDRHVRVDDVIGMAKEAGISASVASVYNTLNCFADAGLLRKVNVDIATSFFDTNLSNHHHLYIEDEQKLFDIPESDLEITKLPSLPNGRKPKSIDLMIRV